MKFGLLAGNVVHRAEGRRAGIVVVAFPGGEEAVFFSAAGDFDDTSRAKVSPGKFFFARPDEFHRLASRAGEPSRFDCRLARMFAAVARAGVGDDHADVVFGDMESAGEIAADAKGPLRAGPDGELLVLPFGDRGPRFKRRVGDVGHRVSFP